MLDTGVRPSLIESNTARRLDLPIIPTVSQVCGLCNNAVKVSGYVEAMVQVCGRSLVMERIEVLVSEVATLLLGRKFIEQLVQVTRSNGYRQKEPKRTYARWLMELQELPFRIGYRPGRENVVADYLSRSPALNVDEKVKHDAFEEKDFHTMGPDDLYERIGDQQLQDDTVRTVLEQLRRGDVATGQFKSVSSRLGIRGGILHFQSRVVVSAHLRRETIEASHCQHHFGLAATLDSRNISSGPT